MADGKKVLGGGRARWGAIQHRSEGCMLVEAVSGIVFRLRRSVTLEVYGDARIKRLSALEEENVKDDSQGEEAGSMRQRC